MTVDERSESIFDQKAREILDTVFVDGPQYTAPHLHKDAQATISKAIREAYGDGLESAADIAYGALASAMAKEIRAEAEKVREGK